MSRRLMCAKGYLPLQISVKLQLIKNTDPYAVMFHFCFFFDFRCGATCAN